MSKNRKKVASTAVLDAPPVAPVHENNQPIATDTVAPQTVSETSDKLKPGDGVDDGAIVAFGSRPISYVDIDRLYSAGNARRPGTEFVHPSHPTYRSIVQHGYVAGKGTMRVSISPANDQPSADDQARGADCLVLWGNRRLLILRSIRQFDPELFDRILPGGKVPCEVFEGLNRAEIAIMRQDHSIDFDRVPLDDFNEFLAVRDIVRENPGISAQRVASIMGQFVEEKQTDGTTRQVGNRNWARRRVLVAKMPAFVQEEFLKYAQDPDSTGIRWSMVTEKPNLWDIYTKDLKANGAALPEFRKSWQSAIALKVDGAKKRGGLTEARATELAGQFGESPLAQDLLLIAASPNEKRENGDTLAQVVSRVGLAELALAKLTKIAEFLGEAKFAELLKNAGCTV